MARSLITGIACLLLSCAFTFGAWVPSDEETTQHGAGHEQEHRHHIAFFLGATSGELKAEVEGQEAVESDTVSAFSLGVDYQYRFHPKVAVGALLDHAFGDFKTTVVGGGLFFQPVKRFQVLAAPGFERGEGETRALFRLGAYYEIELTPRVALSPNVNVDFVDGEQVFVYGAALGFGF